MEPTRTDLRLAPIGLEHAEAMSRWLSDPAIAEAVGVHRVVSLDETRRWIEGSLADETRLPFAILADGRHVGNVVLDQFDEHISTARLSIYIGEPDARGLGIGQAGVQMALAYAFAELGLWKVWLIVHKLNEAAIAVYEKSGFEVEGVLRGEFIVGGERLDAVRMGILAERFDATGG